MSFELPASRLMTKTTLDMPFQAREAPDAEEDGQGQRGPRRAGRRNARAVYVAQRLDQAAAAITEALPHYKTSVQNIARGPGDRFYDLVEGRDFPREDDIGIPLADRQPSAAEAGIPVADQPDSLPSAGAENSDQPEAADQADDDILSFIMQGWPPGVPFPGDPELQRIMSECWPHLRVTPELEWAAKWTTRLCRTFKNPSVRIAMMFQPVGDNVLAYFVAGPM